MALLAPLIGRVERKRVRNTHEAANPSASVETTIASVPQTMNQNVARASSRRPHREVALRQHPRVRGP